MEFFEYFDAKYVINLPSRPDRLTRIKNEFKRIGVSFDDITVFPGKTFDEAAGFPTCGTRGCFLSHLSVLKDALAKRAKNILVMEDDNVFSKALLKNHSQLTKELTIKEWGICYFGYYFKEKSVGSEDGFLRTLNCDKGVGLTSFYSIKGSIAERMVSYLEKILTRPAGSPLGGPMATDGAYSWFRKQNPDVITLISVPAAGYQGSSRSDITKENKGKILSNIFDVLRALKSKIEVLFR